MNQVFFEMQFFYNLKIVKSCDKKVWFSGSYHVNSGISEE